MLKFSKILLILCAIITLAKGQRKIYTKFTDTLSVRDKIIYTAKMFGLASENFYYAVCEEANFDYRHCNVIIQKEDEKRICRVRFAPTDSNKGIMSFMSHLIFYPLNDDKVAITWSNYIEFDRKASHLKILDISTCKLIDVPLPTAQVTFVVAYKNALDVGFKDKNYCGSRNCKITINADGQIISEPTDILKGIDVAYLDVLEPVDENAPDQGFYAAIALKSDYGHGHHNEYFYKINGQGKSVQFMTFGNLAKHARSSNSHNLYSLCYTFSQVYGTIGCIQYDKYMNFKLNTTLQFEDGKLPRWLQPYNLKTGGLLLITGRANDEKGTLYGNFSIIKIHQDGQTDKAIEFDDLNFSGAFIGVMSVSVLEKESGEICIYFKCTHEETDNQGLKTRTLQLAIKCLPKA